jgi:CRP-like cAMP-binding protein
MAEITNLEQEVRVLREQLKIEKAKTKVEDLPDGLKRFVEYRLGILDGTIKQKRRGPSCEDVKVYLDKNWSIADIAYKLGTSKATVYRRIKELRGEDWRWKSKKGQGDV